MMRLLFAAIFYLIAQGFTLLPGQSSIDSSFIWKQTGDSLLSAGRYDPSLSYLTKAEASFRKNKNWEEAAMCKVGQGVNYLRKNDFGEMEKALREGLNLAKMHLLPQSSVYSYVYNLLGIYASKTGDYDKALAFSIQSLETRLADTSASFYLISNAYNNVAVWYRKRGDYEKAAEYGEKALEIRLSDSVVTHSALYQSYNNLFTAYSLIEDFPQALANGYKALQELDQLPLKNLQGRGITLYNNLAKIFDKTGQQDSLRFYQKKGLEATENLSPTLQLIVWLTQADLLKSEGNIQEANQVLDQYITLALTLYGSKNQSLSRAYQRKAALARKNQNFKT